MTDESASRIETLRTLAAESPDDATTWFLLGRELLKAGDAADAATAFERAIACDADYAAAYRQLGNALEKAGRLFEAADVYRRGADVAERTSDLQAGKEMRAFLKRMERDA